MLSAEEELLEAEAGSVAGEVARMRAARAALAAAASEAETALAQTRAAGSLAPRADAQVILKGEICYC